MRSFKPTDDDTTLYINAYGGWSINYILESIRDKWGDVDLGDVSIRAEHIHTDCLGYDSYDPSDYTDYLVISYSGK